MAIKFMEHKVTFLERETWHEIVTDAEGFKRATWEEGTNIVYLSNMPIYDCYESWDSTYVTTTLPQNILLEIFNAVWFKGIPGEAKSLSEIF